MGPQSRRLVANTIHVECVEAALLWHYDLEGDPEIRDAVEVEAFVT